MGDVHVELCIYKGRLLDYHQCNYSYYIGRYSCRTIYKGKLLDYTPVQLFMLKWEISKGKLLDYTPVQLFIL